VDKRILVLILLVACLAVTATFVYFRCSTNGDSEFLPATEIIDNLNNLPIGSSISEATEVLGAPKSVMVFMSAGRRYSKYVLSSSPVISEAPELVFDEGGKLICVRFAESFKNGECPSIDSVIEVDYQK